MPDRQIHQRTRHRTDAAENPAGRGDGNAQEAALDQLLTELEAARAAAAEHLASLQRTAADFANFKRRTAEDRERELGLASELLLRKLLVVADDFDRALEAMPADLEEAGWVEGIALVDRKLRSLLESEGVTPIESVGKPFDPREHEAIASVPGTGRPDGEVVAEVQRGYRVRDRVLRPAMVAVASGGDAPASTLN
jgi:molecular chaperone GrpE